MHKHLVGGFIAVAVMVLITVYLYNKFLAPSGKTIASLGAKA
jgi:hypothetical protein